MSENHWKWFLTAFVVLFVCTQSAATATERITDFSCDIDVGADGIMTVTETIKVITEGKKISRGIYRDIPINPHGSFSDSRKETPFLPVLYKKLSWLPVGS